MTVSDDEVLDAVRVAHSWPLRNPLQVVKLSQLEGCLHPHVRDVRATIAVAIARGYLEPMPALAVTAAGRELIGEPEVRA